MTARLVDKLHAQLGSKPVKLDKQLPASLNDEGLIAFASHSFFDGLNGLPLEDDIQRLTETIFNRIRPLLDTPSTLGVWTSETKGSPFHYLKFFPDSQGLKFLCGLIRQYVQGNSRI